MPESRDPIPPGTLDMLILKTLARSGQLHGFEIAEAIRQSSDGTFLVEEGSLYPALQRMLMKGSITGEWGKTSENRRARYYRITTTGQRQLREELEAYRRVSRAIEGVISPA
jgi:transcriptional regulator